MIKSVFLIRKYCYQLLFIIDKILGNKNQVVIFTYHNISSSENFFDVTKENFEAQIRQLIKKYQPITLSDLNAYLYKKKQIVKPSFVLTFDDGYKQVLKVRNFLNSLGIKPALFIITDIDKIERKSGGSSAVLNAADLKKLADSGWEIGCHSASHQVLTTQTGDQLVKEVVKSKQKLENILLKKIKFFAYPTGKYSDQVIKIVKKAGYDLALSMDDEIITPSAHRYKIPRIGVNGSHTLSEFASLPSPSVVKFRKLVKHAAGSLYKRFTKTVDNSTAGRWRLIPRI